MCADGAGQSLLQVACQGVSGQARAAVTLINPVNEKAINFLSTEAGRT